MKKYIILLGLFITTSSIMAQDKNAVAKDANPADSLLNSMSPDNGKDPVNDFKATRLILTQTTKTVSKNTLNFMVLHRFGDFAGKNGGGQTDFGLDAIADVYIGFEYGITDNLNVDFGRSTIGRLVSFDLKYALLRENKDGSIPVSLTLFGESGINTYGTYNTFSDRLSYLAQVIISRQITHDLSIQVSPGYSSDNTANPFIEGNDLQFFSLGAAAHLKVSKHMSLVADYEHPFSSFRTTTNGFHDPVGVGIEIETGGHVFTLNLSNARAIDAINSLSNTQQSISKGQYRIGFTISRIFDFNHKSTYK